MARLLCPRCYVLIWGGKRSLSDLPSYMGCQLFDTERGEAYTMNVAWKTMRGLLPSYSAAPRRSKQCGGVAERSKAVVLKTTVAVMSPGVRIPPPPPDVASSIDLW